MSWFFVQDGETILKKVTDLNIISEGAELNDLCGFLSRYVQLLFTTRCKDLCLFLRCMTYSSRHVAIGFKVSTGLVYQPCTLILFCVLTLHLHFYMENKLFVTLIMMVIAHTHS